MPADQHDEIQAWSDSEPPAARPPFQPPARIENEEADDRLNAERFADAEIPMLIPWGPSSEAWRITDLNAATWAADQAAKAQRHLDNINAWEQREHERIAEVAERLRIEPQNTIEFMTDRLAAFLKSEIDAGHTRKRSMVLPGGTIKLKSRRPSVTVDAETFLAWAAKSAPQLIRTKQEVNKEELNRSVTLADGGTVVLDGEIVEGVAWEPQPDSAKFVAGGE